MVVHPVASIEQRTRAHGDVWTVSWRKGGRKGTVQRVTVGTEKYAQRAKEIAEAHRHQVTRHEVEIMLGIATKSDGTVRRSAVPTVEEWAGTWLSTRTRIGPGQRRRYRQQLGVILAVIGNRHLDEVDGVAVVAVVKYVAAGGGPLDELGRQMSGPPRKPATVDRYYACLTSLFGYAVREKKITESPCARTDYAAAQLAHDDAGDAGDDHVYLTAAEYRRIRDRMAPAGRDVIDFLVGTGCRWSEATAVEVGAVADDGEGVRIHRAWKQDEQGGWYLGATKARTRRTVAVKGAVAAAVARLATGADGRRRPAAELLLTAPQGGRLLHKNFDERFWRPAVVAAMRCEVHPPTRRGSRVAGRELWGPLCGDNGGLADRAGRRGVPCRARVVAGWDRCGTHVGPARDAVSSCDCPGRLRRRPTLHDLRHTFAAWAIAGGMVLLAVSRALGHKTQAVTERVYAGILPEVHAALGDAVASMLED